MRAVKSVSIDSERRVIITFLDGSTETLYPNCIWCDAEALKEIIKELLEEKADAVVVTINDVAIATFADGADEALIRKLLVSIEPIQEGTGDPGPENVRTISGRTGLSVTRCGKNLLDRSKITFGSGSNARYCAYGSDGISASTSIPNGDLHLYPGSYTVSLSGSRSTNAESIGVFNSSGTRKAVAYNNKILSFTITEEDDYMITFVITAADFVSWDNYDIQLEVGSSATEYEAYKADTYSVNWETVAGTVYGGSLDVMSGKLVVDYFKYSPLSSYTPSQFISLGTYTRVTYSGAAVKPGVNAAAPYTGVYSHGSYDNRVWVGDYSHAFCTDQGVGYFYLPCEATAEAIQAYLKSQEDAGTPVTVAYKIATPIEYQLTPQEITTLLGANNIWADSGNILELEYVADTKLYIGESQSGTLGSGRQTITNTEIQPISEKTVEDLSEAVKAETEVERGE